MKNNAFEWKPVGYSEEITMEESYSCVQTNSDVLKEELVGNPDMIQLQEQVLQQCVDSEMVHAFWYGSNAFIDMTKEFLNLFPF